jgi:uncharacterized protein YndB with AHSA1/START domain
MSEMRQVKRKIIVETTPELAFEAVTRDSELREWCSDGAWTEVRPGGRFALHWNSGYHVEGRFLELDVPHRAAVSWNGTGEPGETMVEFSVDETTEGHVEVTVAHRGFGPGTEWDGPLAEAEKGWEVGLDNLKSTLETGVDLRTARQPFLGINLDFLTPERAETEGIAAQYGIYVTGTVQGSGAEAAGLCNGDVIVALGGIETPSFDTLGAALRAHQAGDTVDVELVHGQERRTTQVRLGQRPQAEVPGTIEELAGRLDERQREVDEQLRAAVAGVTEEESEQCPEEGQWSVKQILAHLSDGERAGQVFLVNIAINGWLDAGPVSNEQNAGRLEAILAVTPTLQGLVDRLLADEAETVEILRRLPERTLAHKARFRRISQFMLLGPDHTREHVEQIQRTVEAVRS